jgi:Uma2 family endonuclease
LVIETLPISLFAMQQYPLPESSKFLVHDDGVNAPVYHQRTIADLITGLKIEYRAGRIPYEPLPEMMVGEYSSPTPDVILHDDETQQTPLIIEICQTKGVKADLDKVVRLIDGGLYGIREGFVYDYRTQHWLRYCKGDVGQATETAFSDILQLDLSQFL